MKTITKTSLISLAVAAAIAAAPQAAFAHKSGKKHTHHTAARTTRTTSTATAVTSTDSRLRAMEAEIQSLRGELSKTRAETKSAVSSIAQRADAQEQALDAKLVKHEEETYKKNTLFFRGGYAGMTHNRNDELLVGNLTVQDLGLQSTRNGHNGGAGWYVGAGIDHRLTNDFWGLTDLMAVDGELMFEYKNFGESVNTLVSIYPVTAPGATPLAGQVRNQLTQFTLTASPKIKFNTGTIFTPWIIPVGLGIHVISPPSSGVTVLNPGLMLGVGGEAEFMKAIVAGVDFRYHFTGNDLNYTSFNNGTRGALLKGTSTDGLTAGGYVGFKF